MADKNNFKITNPYIEEYTIANAIIEGEIIGILTNSITNNDNYIHIELLVKRTSDVSDIIPILADKKLLDKLELGNFLHVEGQVRTHNIIVNKKNKLNVYIEAESIELKNAEEGEHINNLNITGILCNKPNKRITPKGRLIYDLTIAINRHKKSDYIPSIAWVNSSDIIEKASIGDKLGLTGRFQSRKYIKKLGNRIEERTAYELSISKVCIEKKCKKKEEQIE